MKNNASKKEFSDAYKSLNKNQKQAVDTLSGPVMVVAGPGTGKTQVLSLRIANILQKTDIKADGILCLTFTNSAVEAMRKRLEAYIGEAGSKVNIFTFHGFGMKVIEENYAVLGLKALPKLLDDAETAILFAEILEGNDWEYLRPRSDNMRYYSDLKSLISHLKRERITSEYFNSEAEKEINSLTNDSESLSTRGESKGEIKKEIKTKIEALERSREVAKFFELYEEAKKTKNVLDYDDVLENLVKIVELSKDATSEIREKYLYVLVDEHQDSNALQNDFLKRVWGKVESPDIFVVGDDRQLIYGFSGASIDHFKGFQKTFKGAKLITLVDNYRSTQIILDVSHALLQSVMSDKKLVSQSQERHPIRLIETEHPDDEIIACALDIKEKISAQGGPASGGKDFNINDCAILVPKNKQVRRALEIMHNMGLAVSPLDALNLFDQPETHAFIRVLKIISHPKDTYALPLSFFDELSGIEPLEAHKYLAEHNMREFSLNSVAENKSPALFTEGAPDIWLEKLLKWSQEAREEKDNDLFSVVKSIGEELLLKDKKDRGELVSRREILDTILALAAKEAEKNSSLGVAGFVSFLEGLESCGEHIPLVIPEREGVKILTLHSSKGQEFDYVWIAHMDERSLNSGKRMNFTLPGAIAEKIEESDIDRVKRRLYVAITRAKRFCTLSYASLSDDDSEQEVARVIADLPSEILQKQKATIKEVKKEKQKNTNLRKLTEFVEKKYTDRYVSASLLNNFFECPWKWYFRNLLQMEEPPVEILEFGSLVHVSIEQILKKKNIPSGAEVEKLIADEVLNSVFVDERVRRRMKKEAEVIIKRWVKSRLQEIKISRKTEESIPAKDERFPHLKIYGKIDLIENLGPKEVRVTDFKTGSVRKKSDIEKLDEEGRMSANLRQLAMYSYLLATSPKWGVDVRESRLEFLESLPAQVEKNATGYFYDRVIQNKEIQLLVKDIEDYDQAIKSGDWVNRPCNYNDYGRNTECEYCKRAGIYKRLQGPLSSPPK